MSSGVVVGCILLPGDELLRVEELQQKTKMIVVLNARDTGVKIMSEKLRGKLHLAKFL